MKSRLDTWDLGPFTLRLETNDDGSARISVELGEAFGGILISPKMRLELAEAFAFSETGKT